MSTTDTPRKRPSPPSPFVLGFWLVLAVWMVYPFTTYGKLAQDGLHDPVAGDLWVSDPGSVYPSPAPQVPNETFKRRFCEMSDHTDRCGDYSTVYTSTPLMLPLLAVLARLGGAGSTFAIRLGGAACYAAGLVLLFRRMGPRVPRILPVLVAVALTPLALSGLGLGQNSPLLFLSSCLGLRGTDRARRAGVVGTIWFLASNMKVFPIALGLLLAARRRWRVLTTAAAVAALLAALVLLLGPTSVISDYATYTRFNSSVLVDSHLNSTPWIFVVTLVPAVTTSTAAKAVVTVAVLAAAGAVWSRYRRCSLDVQWSVAYLLVMFVSPIIWVHYCWLIVAALGAIAAARPQPRQSDFVIIGIAAVVLGAIGLVALGGVPNGFAQAAVLLGAVAALALVEPPPAAAAVADP